MTATEIHVVTAWHEALNAGDVERLVELSHPDVEVGGPRGTGHGAQLLREWVGRTNIRLEPGRIFHEAGTIVVEQEAEWRSPETGESNGTRTVASVFVVSDATVASVVRYRDVAEALRAANLDESHERDIGEAVTTEALHVRRYDPGDKEAVRRLHDDALNQVGAHLGRGPWDEDLDDIEGVYL
ncbi:MAG TPA: nuclear transport factor 2 family protein, partial [Rubrobacter sp.]|nr:nuclear transport factor 2 family protein [Rubrobacter sp.]